MLLILNWDLPPGKFFFGLHTWIIFILMGTHGSARVYHSCNFTCVGSLAECLSLPVPSEQPSVPLCLPGYFLKISFQRWSCWAKGMYCIRPLNRCVTINFQKKILICIPASAYELSSSLQWKFDIFLHSIKKMKVMNVNGKIVLDKWYTCHHWCQNVISVGRRPLTILVNNAFTNMPPSGKKMNLFPLCTLKGNWCNS